MAQDPGYLGNSNNLLLGGINIQDGNGYSDVIGVTTDAAHCYRLHSMRCVVAEDEGLAVARADSNSREARQPQGPDYYHFDLHWNYKILLPLTLTGRAD